MLTSDLLELVFSFSVLASTHERVNPIRTQDEEDVQVFFGTSHVCFIYVLCPGGSNLE